MKLLKICVVTLLMLLSTSCVIKVQTINIDNYSGTQDISDIEFLLKGSDPQDSLNGNTMDALNGLPLP